MKRTYRVPFWNQAARWILVPVFRLILRLLSKVRITGTENIPSEGPYMVVFNHVSIYDPPFLIAFWPIYLEVLGATEVWTRPGQDILVRLWGGIPIRRGEVDRQAMEKMLAALRSGRPLIVSPEGTRSHTPGMLQAKPGVVYLIEQTRVPVIPVGVTGTTDNFIKCALRGERPVVDIRVGAPFKLDGPEPAGLSPRDIRQQKAHTIMMHIAELLPKEYRGVYLDPV